MAERRAEDEQGQQAQIDDYVRSVAGSGGAAAEIDKAKQLLDSGAITQAEFEATQGEGPGVGGEGRRAMIRRCIRDR